MNMKDNISKYSHYFFVLFCLLLFLFSIQILRIPKGACNSSDEQLISQLHSKISNCCDAERSDHVEGDDTIIDGIIVKEPIINCRAHFSGLLMTDNFQSGSHTEIYKLDESSEYVGEGEYPRSILAFQKAHLDTFDGIAIDNGTRVVIYSKENFKGDILMDETGPVIITNKIRIEDDKTKSEVINNNQKIFKEPLNSNYPPSCRKMSKSNMFEWSRGSLKVICNE